MSDKQGPTAEQLSEKKVGDLSVDELVGIFVAVLSERRKGGDPRLIDMSIKEFGEFMLDYLKTRAYQTATLETDTANRILTDWQALENVGAVAQPYRVRTMKDAVELGENLAAFFRTGGQGEMIVAVAVKGPGGGYSKPNGIGL